MKESITVSALNRYTKTLIESDEVLSQVWVEGEISGFKLHNASGHMYFTLKDSEASVPAVMFNSYASKLRFVVKDGMYVVARCKVSLYERDGRFQLYVEDITPKGEGTLSQQLEALKAKLQGEGLFSQERKRPLVRFPKNIGIITSSGAAALKDVINVISRRYPFVKLTVFSSNVQGQLAQRTIIKAINRVNARYDIDEVIITRGGGSKEDLFIFNSEELVRAASTLKVPFISAVGHEVDFTLLDLVADLRAATPSVAAELAVPNIEEMVEAVSNSFSYIQSICVGRIEEERKNISNIKQALLTATQDTEKSKCEKLSNINAMINSLNPANVLSRGYAGIYKNGKSVASARELFRDDTITVLFNDGRAECDVTSVKEEKYEI